MKLVVGSTTLLALTGIALAQPEPAPPTPPENGEAPAAEPPSPPPVVAPVDAPIEAPKADPKFLPPSDPWPPVQEFDANAAASELGFRFGSYGRLIAGTDLRGGKPMSANVVAHGPRIVEDSYLELELSYGFVTPRGMHLRPVITLAFDGTLFHDTGDFDAQPALRNMYLDAQLSKNTSAWVGSRMYRGDDIYLFDYWPLDDQNTIGGGLLYRQKTIELATHAGVNRLNNDYQFQEIEVADPAQGAATILQLDRERMILSGSAAYFVNGESDKPSIKLKVHGEFHALPAGTRRLESDGTFVALPADSGFLVGAEASVYGMSPTPAFRRHLNLYARYAKGLAAFDELAAPTSVGPDLETTRANELTFGAAGNWDFRRGNVMIGALSRRFIDADRNDTDPDDGWEYAVDIRPQARVVKELFAGVDLSYQARFPRGLNPTTLNAEDPAVFQIAPMLVYSPMGPSAYDRPQLRIVYRAAHLNDAARDLFVPQDPRHERTWVHFLGFQAEWWWNSTTYR